MAKSAKKPALARSQEPVAAAKPLATGKEARAAKPTSAASGLLGPAAKSAGPAKTNWRTAFATAAFLSSAVERAWSSSTRFPW